MLRFTNLIMFFFILSEIPHLRPKPIYVTVTRDNETTYSTKIPYMAARVVFIKWIVTFFLEKKYLTATQNTKNGGDVLPKIIQVCQPLFKISFFSHNKHTCTLAKSLTLRTVVLVGFDLLAHLSVGLRFQRELWPEDLVVQYWNCYKKAVSRARRILRR